MQYAKRKRSENCTKDIVVIKKSTVEGRLDGFTMCVRFLSTPKIILSLSAFKFIVYAYMMGWSWRRKEGNFLFVLRWSVRQINLFSGLYKRMLFFGVYFLASQSKCLLIIPQVSLDFSSAVAVN